MDLVGVAAALLLLLLLAVSLPTPCEGASSSHDVDVHVQHDGDATGAQHDILDDDVDLDDEEELWLLGDANVTYSGTELREEGRKKIKLKKFKLKKLLFPLLMSYKLKFFALVPLLVSGLVLLVGTTGMAGFFFALFAATISIKSNKW